MLDISREPMEVAPTAHYSMGGVVVDPETHATDVAGLYAAGEVTAGLHGANRLGGNSLAETVVFGRGPARPPPASRPPATFSYATAGVVAAANQELSSLRSPWREGRSGLKMGRVPVDVVAAWRVRPRSSRALGAALRALQCCLEHADQIRMSL